MPVIIAPKMLVAAKGIAKSITAVSIVPSIPASKTGTTEQRQHLFETFRIAASVAGVIAKYTTAIPKTINKNTGVTVITAVIRKNAAIIPIIMLAIIAPHEQRLLSLQQRKFIFTHLRL